MNSFHVTGSGVSMEMAMQRGHEQIVARIQEITETHHRLTPPVIETQSHSSWYVSGVGFYATFYITLKL
jgi:hypothetical protein